MQSNRLLLREKYENIVEKLLRMLLMIIKATWTVMRFKLRFTELGHEMLFP